MTDRISIDSIYKIKDGLSVSPSSYFSKYIKVLGITKDTITGLRYVTFDYIFIDTGEKLNSIESEMVTLDQFNDLFELYQK